MLRSDLEAVNYQIEQFDKYGVKDKLEKQLAHNQDAAFATTVDDKAEKWDGKAAHLVQGKGMT